MKKEESIQKSRERRVELAMMAINGKTYVAIAKDIGISSGRVRDIVGGIANDVYWRSKKGGYYNQNLVPFPTTVDLRRNKEAWLNGVRSIADEWGVGSGLSLQIKSPTSGTWNIGLDSSIGKWKGVHPINGTILHGLSLVMLMENVRSYDEATHIMDGRQ